MGVGKSMKIFMEGMQNSMMSSGYTGKIVNTPMGPFAWNEATNSWVNQNSGFSIPNIGCNIFVCNILTSNKSIGSVSVVFTCFGVILYQV